MILRLIGTIDWECTEGKHEGVTYDCTHCDYKATEPSSLRRHAKAKHEGVKYDCNQCDFQSGYRADLTIHIKSKHEGLGVSHSSLCLWTVLL